MFYSINFILVFFIGRLTTVLNIVFVNSIKLHTYYKILYRDYEL